MSEQPLVSVVIPVYKRLEYLDAALESVRRQTYSNVEIIVVDDGSGEECHAQLRLMLPPEVTLLTHATCRGTAAARNTGVQHARGSYIAFLDSDDLWLPEKLTAQVSLLQEHPEAGLTYCGVRFFNSDGKAPRKKRRSWTLSGRIFSRLQRICIINSPSMVLIPRQVLEALGPFEATLSSCDDWDLWMRVAWQYPIIADPTVLALYRLHGGQLSRSILDCRQKHVALREKWLAWARQAAPEWTNRMRRYYAADLQRLARSQINCARDISSAARSLDQARQIYPWDLRVYPRLLLVSILARASRR